MLAKDVVPSIGGQRRRYLVLEYRSEADTLPSGHTQLDKLEDLRTNGCLGLRLRLKSGQEVNQRHLRSRWRSTGSPEEIS